MQMRRCVGLIAVVLLLSGCGGAQTGTTGESRRRGSALPALAEWQRALLPFQNSEGLWAERWGSHVALYSAGSVYASNGDDAPTSVAASLFPLMMGEEYQGQTWAVIGIASGIELGVALSSAPERVDLYEAPPSALIRGSRLISKNAARNPLPIERLHQANLLEGINQLEFVDGAPVHDRLRVLRAPPAEAPRYDIIVHATGLTVLSRPHRLYTVERLAALRDLLNPGGRLVIHVQLYEIRAETLQRLLRTFAEAFSQVVMVAPIDLSSDALLIGSNQPLAIQLPTARQLAAAPEMHEWLAHAGIHRPTDVAVRALLADRTELLAYTGSSKAYTSAQPMARDELLLRPPTTPIEYNEELTERLRSEFHTKQGFDERFVSTFYSPDWPFGHPCPTPPECRFLAGLGQGEQLQTALADLALSEIAQAQLSRASDLIGAAAVRGPSSAMAGAEQVLELLRPNTMPPLRLDEFVENGELRQRLDTILAHREDDLAAAIRQTNALRSEISESPELLAPVELVEGYLVCLQEGSGQHHRQLQELVDRREDFARRHPAVYLHLARCLRRDYLFPNAVLAAEQFLAAGGRP